MYKKISGMTGTAQTSAEEFFKVYKLEVESIPPNRGLARKDLNDLIYKNFNAKLNAIAADVKERQKKGQPVLLGTTSIAKNELISAALSQAGIKHEVLNAKNNEREGAIIAQAGHSGAVTVATNVAGRGVDILLGGNPPDAAEAEKVRGLGGLHVIGTDRHEARRIDNQLRGRAGRQGDPGSSQFFLSLDDDLLRIFGGDRIKGMMERFDLPENEPIEFGMVTKAVEQAQEKVEGSNFDMRKHLLEYDDVLNKQRGAVYKRRTEFLEVPDKEALTGIIADAAILHFNTAFAPGFSQFGQEREAALEDARKAVKEAGIADGAIGDAGGATGEDADAAPTLESVDEFIQAIREKAAIVAEHAIAKNQIIGILDMLWMTNLEDLEALQESVGLRAYAQRDPLVEYRHEASVLFKSFWGNFNAWIFNNMFKLAAQVPQGGGAAGGSGAGVGGGSARNAGGAATFGLNIPTATPASEMGSGPKIGRNDPCPCGSKKKWKHCGLLNTEEHQMNMAQGGAKHEVSGG
jgi:preprotein translocase subunit SecA